MKRILFAFVLAMAWAFPALAQEDSGMAAYQAGDYETAARIWAELADQGNAIAQFNLGGMYQKGLGVAQDSDRAFNLFRAAAERGHGSSQYNLGVMYANGTGVGRDYVQGYLWVSLATEQMPAGDARDLALKVREVIERRMSPEQLAQAKQLDPHALLTVAPTAEPAESVDVAADAPVPPEETAMPEEAAIIAEDGYRIQLASYLTEDMAQEGWRRLQKAHEDILALHEPLIERADLEDMRTLYRLKIGDFADRAAAATLCDQLRAEGGDCLVVKIR
ncbi:MAG: SPOR domain-containing protein [Sphingomonadales bacterium]